MKTLANCSDVEFLRQTNKIRKYAEKWLKDTGILDIRNQEMPKLPEDMSEDEKRDALREHAHGRLNAMLDAALETHAEETAGLLRLMCFVDPQDDKTLKMPQIMSAAAEMMNNQDILDFFTSLGRLGLMNT
jgi:hypothetical protein